MIQAMYNGVSGLRAHKTMMDVISNNIANINTVGFKASTVNFKEMLSQTIRGASAPISGNVGGIDPMQIGLGTSIGSIGINQSQGSLLPTGSSSDVAIEGNGFFALGDGTGMFFSRDGSFKLDADSNLVSSSTGLKVLGWEADLVDGVVDDSMPVTPTSSLTIPLNKLSISRQTSEIVFGGNLNAASNAGDSWSPTANVYDSLGIAHPITITFTKTAPITTQEYANPNSGTLGTGDITINVPSKAPVTITLDDTNNTLQGLCNAINASSAGVKANIVTGTGSPPTYTMVVADPSGKSVSINSSGLTAGSEPIPTFGLSNNSQWSWTATSPDAAAGSSSGSGMVVFGHNGQKLYGSTGQISLQLATPNGSAAPINVKLSYLPITQQDGANTADQTSQDGMKHGVLDGFTIGRDGVITGSFTNGASQSLGRICLAGFSNPSGLTKIGNSLWAESGNSGVAQIGRPAIGSMGKLASNCLESSNVDLASEFANMIVAQRGFQANSRIITTSDELLQELVQMKR